MANLTDTLRLRNHQFETGRCEYCRYWRSGYCQVLELVVDEAQVCDAFQADENVYKQYAFDIAEADVAAFAAGMKKMQPYEHKVLRGVDTPVGYLLIIEDTMKPKPHRFSLDMDFSSEHMAREHHWTQAEVDKIIRLGKKS